MIDTSILTPAKDMLIENIPILLGAMLSFLALVWASKKVLYLLDISDFGIASQIKRDEKRVRQARQRNKITNSFLKTTQTQKERERRKKLYKTRQLRKKQQETKRLERAKEQRDLFQSTKTAFEMRQNELIQEAKVAQMHHRINIREPNEYLNRYRQMKG